MDQIQQEDHVDEEHTSLSDEPGVEIETLDPKGDLVLAVGRRHLLVSSRVLELSSMFFQKMLQSNAFLEGVDQPNADQPPTKQLHEDHTEIFSLICRVLHYVPVHAPDCIDDYRALADLCNFYGCGWALSFHVRAWIEAWQLSNLSADELQTLLWATFVFHLRDRFQDVSLHLAQALTADQWKAWEVHLMPARLKGTTRKDRFFWSLTLMDIFLDDVRELCETVKNKVQQQIEFVIDEVAANNEVHRSKRGKICGQCFDINPLENRTCDDCFSSNIRDSHCTNGTRSIHFKKWLQSQGCWPLSRLNKQSCRSFLGKMPSSTGGRIPCGSDDSCPLKAAKERLMVNLRTALTDVVRLKLEDYRVDLLPEEREKLTL